MFELVNEGGFWRFALSPEKFPRRSCQARLLHVGLLPDPRGSTRGGVRLISQVEGWLMTREEIQRITDRLWPDYTAERRRNFRKNLQRCHELGMTGTARGRLYLSVPIENGFLSPRWCKIFDIPEQDQLQVDGVPRMPLGRVNISENFTLGEFRCRSFKCAEYPGTAKEIRLNLKLFESLELFRGQCDDQAITINSGFRSHGWNKYVGGAQASYHLDGWAADIPG